LWHGAGWNFLIWGALHGSYLVANHSFSHIRHKYLLFIKDAWFAPLAWLMTFLAVVVGWVFFRAPTFNGATHILGAMTGAQGISLPAGILAQLNVLSPMFEWFNVKPYFGGGMVFVETWLWIIALMTISVLLPNVLQLFYKQLPQQTKKGVDNDNITICWQPSAKWACFISALFIIAVSTLGRISDFLYFNF
jgi:alginate O-acetyltransferase complex protein AlgI